MRLTAVLAALFIFALPAEAQIGVSPPITEVTLGDRPVTQSLEVINFGSRDVDVRVKVVNFDLDDDNKVRTTPSDEQSLDQWIVVQPGTFALPAGKSQVVRFSIRPRVRPSPGEHRAQIYFEEVPGSEEPPATQFRVLFRIGAAVYAHVGEVTRLATLGALDVSPEAARFDITSTGTANVRLDGGWAIWKRAGFPGAEKAPAIALDARDEWKAAPAAVAVSGRLPKVPVYPATRRVVQLRFPPDLAPGDYVFQATGTLGTGSLSRFVPFRVTARPTAPPAATPTPTPHP